MGHIITVFHHGGSFYKGQYVSKLDNIIFNIDKDHFSLTEMKYYAKDARYDDFEAFYVEDPTTHRFVKLESDSQLYNCVKELWSGSYFNLYLKHVIVEEGGLTTSTVLGTFSGEKNIQELGNSSRASHPEDGINGTLNEGDGDDNDEENTDSLDFKEEDLDGVSDEDDDEVDEELRAFRENLRQEKRNEAAKPKERIKKSSKNQEVELGEAGIEKGFEDIIMNKAAKYIGSVGSPKVTELEDGESQSKKAMELTKGRIAELIGEPDLLRRMMVNTGSTVSGCLKDHLGVVWRGSMGCLTMSYLGD
uniref:Gag-pol polyprotein n=1 Tax=Solanum tuberosum TaxID=4113 RepID=M1D8J5_SOLTU